LRTVVMQNGPALAGGLGLTFDGKELGIGLPL
jgi:hypothetical protein